MELWIAIAYGGVVTILYLLKERQIDRLLTRIQCPGALEAGVRRADMARRVADANRKLKPERTEVKPPPSLVDLSAEAEQFETTFARITTSRAAESDNPHEQ